MKCMLAALVISLPVAALAEPPDSALLRYDFQDELVQGDLARPDAEILRVRRRQHRESLVLVRTQFTDELMKSVERL